ncbi:MAG: 2-amino-4-hydroxy-6-hydroxymethyldihydropteridine diphosphokinase [Cardiobacteriaceae bacterium]|nr:2-amino-4-hydroxy-6-hydroxymethyldihydropteridine diphosphokinase [Cardiobacteriaceae bacterium]
MNKKLQRVWIAFGSNMNNPLEQLKTARDNLRACGLIEEKASNIYQTAAWGYTEQPDFFNAVVRYKTDWGVEKILEICQLLEAKQGRERPFKNAPRTLDLDILLFGNNAEISINSADLIIPHKYIKERNFVIVPLMEIDPKISINGEEISIIAKRLEMTGIMQIKTDNNWKKILTE